MSVYLLFFFGAGSAGSLGWGVLAGHFGILTSLWSSAACLLLGLIATGHIEIRSGEGLNLQPSGHWPEPEVIAPVPFNHGPVLVEVRFHILPEVAPQFRQAMQELRQLRLQNGVLRWGLFVDVEEPTLYREVYLEESWSAHQRHRERVTVHESEICQRVYAFHSSPDQESPEVRHLIYCDGVFPATDFDFTVLLMREAENLLEDGEIETHA
jgi:hypothetical protein